MDTKMVKCWQIMISLIFLVSVAVADDYCPRIDKKTSKPNKQYETVDPANFIDDVEPLFASGDVYCVIRMDIRNRVNTRSRREVGVYGGVRYRIHHSDGSGSIQGQAANDLSIKDKHSTNWGLSCRKDEFDDTHTCSLSRGDLRIGLSKDGNPFIVVGHSHYPGTTVAIRIDQDEPVVASEKAHFVGDAAKSIVDRLLTAQRVLTRYQEWPYKAKVDESFEPFGFAQAWQIMNRVFEQGR
jgi:hypothetical protein